ncbi:MAG: putative polysaccharide biosynthesis protein [Sarcina sp.]
MKKQTFITGGLILAGMGVLSKFIGLFFRWPLVMMMGDEGMGYYQMVFPIFSVFIAVAGGVPIALSKLISENNTMGKEADNLKLVSLSTMLLMIVAIAGGFGVFVFKDNLISLFGWDEKVVYSLMAICIAPIFIAIINPIRGYFQGYQNMNSTAISQFLEQIGRVVIGVGIAYLLLPYGIEYAAGGAVLGATAGGIFATVYLVYKFLKTRRKCRHNTSKVTSSSVLLKRIIMATLPIAIGSAVVSVMGVIDSILVPKQLLLAGFTQQEATILFSQLAGKATTLVHIPLTIAAGVGCALVPAISASLAAKHFKELSYNVGMSLKFAFVIALPCTFGMFFLAEPIMATLFPGNDAGANILRYLSLTIPFLVITQITTAILQGIGKMKIPVINMFLGSLIKVVLTYILVAMPSLGIDGAVISSIISYSVITILNMICLKYQTKYKVKWSEILFKPFVASLAMILVALISFLIIIDYVKFVAITCLLSIMIGGIIYLGLIFALKVLDYNMVKSNFGL